PCAWQRCHPDVNGSLTRERRQGAKEERMPHWTVPKAMMIMLFGTVLLSTAHARADAIGTTTTVKPLARTAVIEVPRDGAGREVRETAGMALLVLSGGVLGVGLGVLGYRVVKGLRGRQERQRAIDQLIEQFQALFREIDSSKNPYP